MRKKGCMSLAALLLFAILLPARVHAAGTLTVMIYLSGADLESRMGSASADMEEILAALPCEEGVDVLLFTGGACAWHNGLDPEKNILSRMTEGGLSILETYPGSSLGSPDTLAGFLKAGMAFSPADRYALILWSHGGGPLEGICFDERFPEKDSMDRLSLREIAWALESAGCGDKKLAFLGCDACVMACAEAAAAFAPYAEVLVASQEPVKSTGWDYSFLRALRPSDSGEACGRLIVDACMAALPDHFLPADMACLDLTAWDACVRALGALFDEAGALLSGETFPLFAACRAEALDTGSTLEEDLDLVDCASLLGALEDGGLADTAACRSALESLVSYSRSQGGDLCGVSVYFPLYNKDRFSASWGAAYEDMGFVPEYREFIGTFALFWLPEPDDLSDAEAMEAMEAFNLDYVTVYPEEEASVISARADVLEALGGGEYRRVYSVEDVTAADDEVFFPYAGEALYAIDETGGILCGPLSYETDGDSIVLTAVPLEGSGVVETVWRPGENGVYRITETAEGEALLISPVLFSPGKGVPVSDWFHVWEVPEGPVKLDGTAALRFLPLWADRDRAAVFELTSPLGTVTVTEPTAMFQMARVPLIAEPETRRYMDLTAAFLRACLYTQANKGLEIGFSFEYGGSGEAALTVKRIWLDDAAIDEGVWDIVLPGGQETAWDLMIPAAYIREAGITQARTLSLEAEMQWPGQRGVSVTLTYDFPCHMGMIL